MMIEEYKETVLHELEKAVNDKEVEKIVNRFVERIPEIDLFRYLVIIYLRKLQNELPEFSRQNADSSGKHNIGHALNYLREISIKREKVQQ